LLVKKPNGFHCECPEKKGIFGRFCQVHAPRGCQGENVRKMSKRSLLRSRQKNVSYKKKPSFLGYKSENTNINSIQLYCTEIILATLPRLV
jgi:hypothetical protein